MSTRQPMFHLRRQMRLQAQEIRRVQRETQAAQLAAMDAFAEHMATQHRVFVQQLADQERLIAEAEGPPEVLAALHKQLH